MTGGRHSLAIVGTIALLSACASERSDMSSNRPAWSPAPAIPREPEPERAPEHAVASINRDLGPGETLWHVRAALNVASLSCTGPERSAIIANYNTILKHHREMLAQAYAAEQAAYRTRYGANWQRMNDTHLTRLYNFFAGPMAQNQFCRVAFAISGEVRDMAPTRLEAFAPGALARLERPFIGTRSASR